MRRQLVASDKEEFTAPIARQVGAREIVRVQPLIRLVASLASGDDDTADIPPFDPTRQLAADNPTPSADEAEEDGSDTAISIKRSDLGEEPIGDDAPAMSDEGVTALVEAELALTKIAEPRGSGPLAPQRLLSMALSASSVDVSSSAEDADEPNPFRAIEVRVVPENVTTLAKADPASRTGLTETRDIVLQHDQTLAEALAKNGADPARVRSILSALSEHARTGLPEGQHMSLLLMHHGGDPTTAQLARVTLYGVGGVEEIAAERDAGGFVPVAAPAGTTRSPELTSDADDESTGNLYAGIYEAVLRNGLPREVAERIVSIFVFGMDMKRAVKATDRLEVLVSPAEKAGGQAELLYASLIIDGVKHRAYRFEEPETGTVNYFNEDGGSLRRFLLRMPIAEGRITSPFGTRIHPILHYARFHNGIDWANKAGTPIMATGNGTVVFAGPRGGYGNRIEIRHANGYATAYNHLQRLSHSVHVGATVRQGQVIAYMGSTGLSTGPHVHYEVSVNGRFLDPMTIRLPDSHGVPDALKTIFARQVVATNSIRHHETLALSTEPL
ncbi:M23 family metallopeptidase [Methylobacterium sp. C25]|uniref:M23 family metallopeptidase n=1 Tax=Methylobacterium sp. C25 TaxID=2721622 RepID=UPI001F1C0E0C|nr:M23 family metallopeptidase [Methylobacterium sp. C25]